MYIPVEAIEEVKKRIEKYNRKWGTEVTYTIDEPVLQTTTLSDGRKVSTMRSWVKLHAPKVRTSKEGVELLEIVSIKNGTEHVTFKGTEEYTPYRKDECDHCHSKRKRNLYFIIRYQGEVKQIGSGCVKEYLGGSIYSVFSGFYKLVEDVEKVSSVGISGVTYYESILDIAKAVNMETEGFTSKWESAKYGMGTSEKVKLNLTKGKYQLDTVYSFSEEDQKDFVQHILHNRSVSNEVSLNICWACLNKENNLKMFVPFSSVGVCAYAIYDYFRAKKEGRIEREKAPRIEPVSESVDSSITFEGDVKYLYSGTNDYGTYLVYLVSNGRQGAIWYTSKRVQEGNARVTGKVKGIVYKKDGTYTRLGGRVKVETI